MTVFVNVADLVNPQTGKTWRQENMERVHKIPIGTLVETSLAEWMGDGMCLAGRVRARVVYHGRDCDGTPLYVISRWGEDWERLRTNTWRGLSEESLTVIAETPEILSGHDLPDWYKKAEDEQDAIP